MRISCECGEYFEVVDWPKNEDEAKFTCSCGRGYSVGHLTVVRWLQGDKNAN